jgi:hypothetical protein
VVAPLGSVVLVLYGLARLAIRKRQGRPLEPYAEWLALRAQLRSRPAPVNGEGEPHRDLGIHRG